MSQPEQLWKQETFLTNQHYDQDPRIFELFLGRTLKYSAALYESETDDLDGAQLNKLDFIARSIQAGAGKRILDIGCGWGSLVLFLTERYRCEVVGVTPSPRQAEYIRAAMARRPLKGAFRIDVGHCQELSLEPRSFDAITMVGSITHIAGKADVIARCYRLCRPGGRVYLSETCFRNAAKRREFEDRPGTDFVLNRTFGWAELIPLSDYVRFLEDAGFSMMGLNDLTKHYYKTIEAWRSNATANRHLLEQIESGLADKFIRYFDVANAGWGFTTKQYALLAGRNR
jgi:cyclopropane-fatty-acyl-phospholipid synthase